MFCTSYWHLVNECHIIKEDFAAINNIFVQNCLQIGIMYTESKELQVFRVTHSMVAVLVTIVATNLW